MEVVPSPRGLTVFYGNSVGECVIVIWRSRKVEMGWMLLCTYGGVGCGKERGLLEDVFIVGMDRWGVLLGLRFGWMLLMSEMDGGED